MMLNIKYISHQFEYGNVLNGSQIVAIGLFYVAVQQRLFWGYRILLPLSRKRMRLVHRIVVV